MISMKGENRQQQRKKLRFLYTNAKKLKTELYWDEKKKRILLYAKQTVFFSSTFIRKTNDHGCKFEFLQIKDAGKIVDSLYHSNKYLTPGGIIVSQEPDDA